MGARLFNSFVAMPEQLAAIFETRVSSLAGKVNTSIARVAGMQNKFANTIEQIQVTFKGSMTGTTSNENFESSIDLKGMHTFGLENLKTEIKEKSQELVQEIISSKFADMVQEQSELMWKEIGKLFPEEGG